MTVGNRAVLGHLRHRAQWWDWESSTKALCIEAAAVIARHEATLAGVREVLDGIVVDGDGRVRAHDLAGLAVLLEAS